MSVLLRRFYNPYSAFENGTLCDEEFKGDNCDNWFEIRLKRYSLSYDSEPWEYYGKTNILGGDAFHFPKDGKAIGTNITNPFLFKFKGKWPVSEQYFLYLPQIKLHKTKLKITITLYGYIQKRHILRERAYSNRTS